MQESPLLDNEPATSQQISEIASLIGQLKRKDAKASTSWVDWATVLTFLTKNDLFYPLGEIYEAIWLVPALFQAVGDFLEHHLEELAGIDPFLIRLLYAALLSFATRFGFKALFTYLHNKFFFREDRLKNNALTFGEAKKLIRQMNQELSPSREIEFPRNKKGWFIGGISVLGVLEVVYSTFKRNLPGSIDAYRLKGALSLSWWFSGINILWATTDLVMGWLESSPVGRQRTRYKNFIQEILQEFQRVCELREDTLDLKDETVTIHFPRQGGEFEYTLLTQTLRDFPVRHFIGNKLCIFPLIVDPDSTPQKLTELRTLFKEKLQETKQQLETTDAVLKLDFNKELQDFLRGCFFPPPQKPPTFYLNEDLATCYALGRASYYVESLPDPVLALLSTCFTVLREEDGIEIHDVSGESITKFHLATADFQLRQGAARWIEDNICRKFSERYAHHEEWTFLAEQFPLQCSTVAKINPGELNRLSSKLSGNKSIELKFTQAPKGFTLIQFIFEKTAFKASGTKVHCPVNLFGLSSTQVPIHNGGRYNCRASFATLPPSQEESSGEASGIHFSPALSLPAVQYFYEGRKIPSEQLVPFRDHPNYCVWLPPAAIEAIHEAGYAEALSCLRSTGGDLVGNTHFICRSGGSRVGVAWLPQSQALYRAHPHTQEMIRLEAKTHHPNSENRVFFHSVPGIAEPGRRHVHFFLPLAGGEHDTPQKTLPAYSLD